MTFKTDNWGNVGELSRYRHVQKVRVAYFEADLFLVNSGRYLCDMPTTAVVLWQGNRRFIGIAQCGSRDEYNKEKGREIAAGRALKAYYQFTNDSVQPSGQKDDLLIYGNMVEEVIEVLPEHLLFAKETK